MFSLIQLVAIALLSVHSQAESAVIEQDAAKAAGFRPSTYYVVAECRFITCSNFGEGLHESSMCAHQAESGSRLLVYQMYGFLDNGDFVALQDSGLVQFSGLGSLVSAPIGNLSASPAKVRVENGVIKVADHSVDKTDFAIAKQQKPDFESAFVKIDTYAFNNRKDAGIRSTYRCFSRNRVK